MQLIWVFGGLSAEDWASLGAIAAVVTVIILLIEKFFGLFGLIFAWVKSWRQPDTPSEPEQPFPAIRPPGARNVIGREGDYRKLCRILDSGTGAQITSKGAVLLGEGGRGKTTLARYYAERRKDHYAGGLWVPAQDRAGLFAALAGFGHSAFDLTPPDPVTEAHIGVVLDKIAESEARLLFVFDNVDDYKMVAPWVPKGAKLHVILTTRTSAAHEGFTSLPLDVLEFDRANSPAVDLLLQEAGQSMASPETRAAAWALAKELGGFPLALVIAGGLVKEGENFADLQGRVAEIIAVEPVAQDYPTSLLAAVTLSYDLLSEDAQALADICAWWAPEGIEARLFTDAPGGEWWEVAKDELSTQMQALVADPARVRAALREVRQRSLLQPEKTGDRYEMHRLTATVLRQRQAAGGETWARDGAALLAAMYPAGARSPEHPEQWEDCRQLTPHAFALWEKAEMSWNEAWGQPDWAAMDTLLNQCGGYLFSQGDNSDGLIVLEASLRLIEARLGEAARDIPLALGNLGLTLSRIRRLDEAQARLDRALVLDKEHRPYSEDMADSLMQRASLEFRRTEAGEPADLAQAELWIEEARALRETLFGAVSEEVAYCWNDLGYLRDLQGRGAEAAENYETAWRIWRALPQPNRNALATSAMNTGASWLQAGDAARAEVPLREAHDIQEEIFAARPDNVDRRNSAGWLIACLYSLARAGEDPEARRAEAEALCAAYGFDPVEREKKAERYPIAPIEG